MKKKVLSIIPLLILIVVALVLWDGSSDREEANKASDNVENISQNTGNESDEKEEVKNENDDIPTGWRVEPKMTYSPDTKVYLTGEEYGTTNEQYEYRGKWLDKEQKVRQYKKLNSHEPVKKENVYSVGSSVPLFNKRVNIKVNEVEVYDSINDFDKVYFGGGDDANIGLVSKNGRIGTAIKEKRYYLDGELSQVIEENVEYKLVVLDCTLTCESDWVETIYMNDFEKVFLEEEGEYYVDIVQRELDEEIKNMGVDGAEIRENGLHAESLKPCMFDKSIAKRVPSFYTTYIGPGEEMDVKIGFFVERELMNNLCVAYMDGTDYLYTDSYVQKVIKLF